MIISVIFPSLIPAIIFYAFSSNLIWSIVMFLSLIVINLLDWEYDKERNKIKH